MDSHTSKLNKKGSKKTLPGKLQKLFQTLLSQPSLNYVI